jgi:hypothetical protein
VEIIVHEDGGPQDKQQQVVDYRDRISTLILNHGHNVGLARSWNRCRAMASSSYLMGNTTDTYLTSSFLFDMKAALDLPYVGIVNVVQSVGEEGPGVHVTAGGTKIGLSKTPGSVQPFAIRAEVWDEVGGWNTEVQTTSSDGGFVGSVFGAGYFSVKVEGTVINEMWAHDGKTNTGEGNSDYIESCRFAHGDVNVPPIFKLPEKEYENTCRKRWEDIYAGINGPRLAPEPWESWYNMEFISQEARKLFGHAGVQDIDWEFAKTYGHDRWKDRIMEDFNL